MRKTTRRRETIGKKLNEAFPERQKAIVGKLRREVSENPVEDRIRFARSVETEEAMLAALATDATAAVRLAVARNRKTSIEVLAGFEKNQDGEVRKASRKDLEWSRTVKFSPRK
jgi:hypothetical protein